MENVPIEVGPISESGTGKRTPHFKSKSSGLAYLHRCGASKGSYERRFEGKPLHLPRTNSVFWNGVFVIGACQKWGHYPVVPAEGKVGQARYT